MRWLVALALAVLVGTAISTNVVNATRSATVIASGPAATTPTIAATPPATATSVTAPSGQPSPADAGTSLPAPAATIADGFTLVQLAGHASEADCWLAIDNQVYDVSAYLDDHPGGSRTIVEWCGQEATVAFATEDGRGEHSADAYALLADYRLGALVAA